MAQRLLLPPEARRGSVALLSAIRQHQELSFHLAREARADALIDGRAKPFDQSAIGTCLRDGQGYSMAYDAELRARSTADALAFLRRELMP